MRFKTSDFFLLPFAFSICAFLLTLLACCKKEQNCPPDLPCATQSGENTFGCYIDGEPWVAGIAPYILDPTLHKFVVYFDETEHGQYYDNRLIFHVLSVDSTDFDFMWWNFKFIEEETENVNQGSNPRVNLSMYLDNSQGDYNYNIDTFYTYNFHFTKIDTAKNIIAGTFDFRAISEDGLDTIYITGGRFDNGYHQE